MNISNKGLKIGLPVLALLTGSLASWGLVATRPVLEPSAPVDTKPRLSVFEAQPTSIKLQIHSQGVVSARDEIDLITEVKGKLVYLHPDFVVGGFFAKNAVLARLDAREYELNIAEAQAQIAESERQLAMEQAQAEQARTEWKTLGEGKPTALAMHEPQLAEARAKLKSAQAHLKLAELELSRCEIHAPFAGMFQSKNVSLGQQMQAGDKLAKLYGTEAAEIRLPLAVEQLAYLDINGLHDSACTGKATAQCPEVTLSAELAGAKQLWQGRIVRSEGTVDNSTGVIYLVAKVQNPYQQQGRPALLNGLFVQADIQGKEIHNVFVLPQAAINAAQEILLVDKTLHLHIVPVKVLRNENQHILLTEGLKAGDKIVLSGIDVPVENQAVEIEQVLPAEKI